MKSQLIELAKRDAPLETIGLLGGTPRELHAIAPALNHSPTPRVAFYVERESIDRIGAALRASGHPVVGYYHSHLDGRCKPSVSDINLCPPDWLMLIIAGEQLGAWRGRTELEIIEQFPPEPDEEDDL